MGKYNRDVFLRLSEYAQPSLLNGNSAFCPQNLIGGDDRIEYVTNLTSYVKNLSKSLDITKLKSKNRKASQFIEQLPFAANYLEIDRTGKKHSFRSIYGFQELLGFDLQKLSLALLDGRNRDLKTTFSINTGALTPGITQVFQALAQGASHGSLDTLAKRAKLGNIDHLLDAMKERGLLDEISGPTRGPQMNRWEHDGVTWLGHAGLVISEEGSSVWIDPVLRPKIKWSNKDKKELFSPKYFDSLLMDNYENFPTPVSFQKLPYPDLVCITHQDRDHFDLGTLSVIPNSCPIVVPQYSGHPWDVDLKKVIHRVLGPQRKVITLGHYHSIKTKSVKVTAVPFVGEMPVILNHKWNCYFIETKNKAIGAMADSVIGEEVVPFFKAKYKKNKNPLLLCGRSPNDGSLSLGYRDNMLEDFENFFNPSRLWPWYLPIVEFFRPVRQTGPSHKILKEFYRTAGLRHYFSYAAGCTPWFRLFGEDDIFTIAVENLEVKDFKAVERSLNAVGSNLSFFPAKYAKTVDLER